MSDQNQGQRQHVVQDKKYKKIKGIFSTQTIAKVGTGTTTRKTIRKTYWHVDQLDEDNIQIQPLNKNYVPSGPRRKISKEDFLKKFSPEPEFYVSTVFPRMQELNQTIERGEKHRKKGETYSAKFEFQTALKVDEDNIRANFGLGLTYLDRGETPKANDIFKRVVGLEAAFETEHKHLFNEFGISLRKNRMYDQALEYYTRALELTKDDENLHLNIARAYMEKGMMEEAVDHIRKALDLSPGHPEGVKFWAYMTEKGYVDEPVPGGVPESVDDTPIDLDEDIKLQEDA
jgi:tetratricopeptide (TPR) repeat protein